MATRFTRRIWRSLRAATPERGSAPSGKIPLHEHGGSMPGVKNVLILGAAGRDFHNFNTVYRNDGSRRVVAFTATQIPNIDGRRYPPELAGPDYPSGIPI